MKIFCLVLSLVSLFLVSCNKETFSNEIKVNEIDTGNSASKFHIYYAHWSEWGRASRGCDGWGLCNYTDCWFCNVDDRYSGQVVFDDETMQGNLFIELDPSAELIQADAIKNKEKFYIDEDIINVNSTLHKGIYEFDPSIGKYGGYKIDITIK